MDVTDADARFRFEPTRVPDVVRVVPRFHRDERGFFAETYRSKDFERAGLPGTYVQENHARSSAGVLRGLHYQLPPHAQGKLVRVASGAVFDVAVDVRTGSATFGSWVGEVLSDENGVGLYVPPGFAHGYAVLSDQADFLYQVTSEYAPDYERGVRWDDPEIGIRWPIEHPIVSERDRRLPPLGDAEVFPSVDSAMVGRS